MSVLLAMSVLKRLTRLCRHGGHPEVCATVVESVLGLALSLTRLTVREDHWADPSQEILSGRLMLV